jgi:hypothetical protein
MRTRYIATVPLDPGRLARDLGLAASSFQWSEAYSDYLFGGPWKSCMLWARGGQSGDGVMTNYSYDQPSALTEYGKQLSYLEELINITVDVTRLDFARLAMVSNSVIIPHRDLLEFSELPDEARIAHRVHIPLATNDDCFFSEQNTVFRMREGEIWFLDASQLHSVASLSEEPRIHLICDFAATPAPASLVCVASETAEVDIPASRIVGRPALSDADRADLLRLADILTIDTFSEVFSIVIKKHFRFDGGDNFAWDTMIAIARSCKDSAVLPYALDRLRYFTLERSACGTQ